MPLYGYLYGILAAALYGTNPMFALPLYQDGLDAWSVLLFRYALSLPLLAGVLVLQHQSFKIQRNELMQLIVLGVLMALSSVCLYVSYLHMDAGIASTILFIYPILTAILMATVYHERITPLVWCCLGLATIGIVVLYDGGVSHVSISGVMLVILSAITYAVYLTFINKGSITHLSSVLVTFYVLLFGSVMLLTVIGCKSLFGPYPLVFPYGWHWCYSFGAALFPTAVSLLLTTLAIQRIGSTETAILGALEPITAVLIGMLLFGEQLSLRSVIGILIIIVAVTMVVEREKISGAIDNHWPKRFGRTKKG